MMIYIFCSIMLTACQQLPSQAGKTVQGKAFIHRVIEQRVDNDTLTVYIEGDGRPWRSRYKKAHNPSSKKPPLYPLMLKTSGSSLYLGRPCYFVEDDAHCSNEWWTEQRYSETVVSSMNAVLNSYSQHYKKLVFIGHSGGATLAVLLAARQAKTSAVITIAGNLDILAWTQYHGYSPLTGSLNPIDQTPLTANICQVHVIAAQDQVIQERWIRAYSQKQQGSKIFILTLKDSAHNDFAKNWQDITKAMQQCQ
ncbi:MAG: alpha/beta hydrolase [Pseudomonadales bacterium]|nr:alpha/beta hydrolase [Pseudomonadales bacterium]